LDHQNNYIERSSMMITMIIMLQARNVKTLCSIIMLLHNFEVDMSLLSFDVVFLRQYDAQAW